MSTRLISLVLVAGFAGGCASRQVEEPKRLAVWMALYEDRDYFRLRDELREADPPPTPRVLFLRAAVLHAFNRPAESDGILEALFERTDTDGMVLEDALFLRLKNLVRQSRHADAAAAAESILALRNPRPDAGRLESAENMRRLMTALADVAPQETVIHGTSVLEHAIDSGRIPVRIDGHDFVIPFDTGANLSLLMRSEAERLGLRIRPAGVEVGTSTDKKVYADLAVAARVEIGRIEYRHVAFLVLPDEQLTFPGGHRIEGLVGFPLIEAMGEVRFHRNGSLEVPAVSPEREPQNLALHQLEPLVRVGHAGHALLCRLDTGADDTTLYEPFYRRFPELFATLGEPKTVEAVGGGGIRTIVAFTLPDVAFEFAGATVKLQAVEVYTQPSSDSDYLDCNLGRNVLSTFDEYAINFRSMSLTVR